MNSSPLPSKRKNPPTVIAVPYWIREFSLIRLSVACCAGAIGISAAAIFASNWYLEEARENLAQAQQQRLAAFNNFAQVESEKQDIRTYQPQFVALRNKGLIGEENRLAWLDAIRQVQEDRQLSPLTYEIDPQQPLTLKSQMGMGGYQLRGSRMRVHLDLLHEMDLFNFIGDLQQRSYFAVQDCLLKRLPGGAILPNAPLLSADCTFNWLTLTPVSAMQPALKRKAKR